MSFHYTCSACKGAFNSDVDDDDARTEARDRFGDIDMESMAIVCDDCFLAMGYTEPAK